MTSRGTGRDWQTLGEGGLGHPSGPPTLSPASLFCRISDEELLCATPPSTALASVPIHLQVGGAKVPGSWTFDYLEDPVVLGISPNCGYA